jgi:hypothetical protein
MDYSLEIVKDPEDPANGHFNRGFLSFPLPLAKTEVII